MQTHDQELQAGDTTAKKAPGFAPLGAVKYVQNIGRFEKGQSVAGAGFGPCTLVFGENGWGKSTLADLLRSLTTHNSDVLIGRKTLAGGPEQKAVLAFGTAHALFEDGAWSGIRPRIAVYDSAFVNDNVFSGDFVSNDHLKKQYGLVVGEEGVRLVRRIVELDNENRQNNTQLRLLETQLDGIIKAAGPPGMSAKEFLSLPKRDDIDTLITAKDTEVKRTGRAKEIKAAGEPLSVPVPSETEAFRKALHTTIEQVAQDAVMAVRAHIARHQSPGRQAQMSHESWLEVGAAFPAEEDCPFCGQHLDNRTLVDSYAEFFGQAYKDLAADVKAKRDTLARYSGGDFGSRVAQLAAQNGGIYTYWKETGAIDPPVLEGLDTAVAAMEDAAGQLDAALEQKQANLTAAAAGRAVETALAAWDKAREEILRLNAALEAYTAQIRRLKESVDASALPGLERDLKTLQASKQRYEPDTLALIRRLDEHQSKKKDVAKQKTAAKTKLSDHGRKITASLGRTINAYLGRLNAGFRIDYKEPNYQGKEPAASYQILINDVPVSPRSTSDTLAQPSFRNTLSAGDRSTLALALFLAKVNADPALRQTIVVLDDPFTSLDNFRRQFTAIEIRKLCAKSGQTIVFSHDKNFLRLLWDKIDQSMIKVMAIQTGAPGMTTIAPYDIEAETRPRHVTERMQIEEYVEGEQHEPAYIRTRLRTVCEDFYRRGDPGLFHEAASLDEIIRLLNGAPDDHPYRGVLEDLRDINEYSRGEHHAPVDDDPGGESSEEELKGFCRKVIDLTRGM